MKLNQFVNKLGKYLYHQLDGGYMFTTSSNACDVCVTLLYQIPRPYQIPGKGKDYNDVHEMILDLNITTYQNKIRVNVIELSPEERTLGYDLYPPEKLQDLEAAKQLILAKVRRRVSKAYDGYNILF